MEKPTELCRLDLMAVGYPTQNLLSRVATCCYLSCYFAEIWLGAARQKKRPTARSKKSTWFQTAIPIIMSSACHAQKKGQRGQNEQKFGPSKKMTISGPSKKMTHSHMRVWEVSTTIPPNFWPIPCHMFLTATPNNKKEQLKTLEWGKKNHMYHPVN